MSIRNLPAPSSLSVGFGRIEARIAVWMAAPANQVTAVSRPDGAGKTGLFNAISGGEQRTPATGRPLFAHPHLPMVDETSLGLARGLAAEVCDILARVEAGRNCSMP
ncbi:hypothetical protein ACUSIJ_15440 [Pseudochelatococcus sp. B33]